MRSQNTNEMMAKNMQSSQRTAKRKREQLTMSKCSNIFHFNPHSQMHFPTLSSASSSALLSLIIPIHLWRLAVQLWNGKFWRGGWICHRDLCNRMKGKDAFLERKLAQHGIKKQLSEVHSGIKYPLTKTLSKAPAYQPSKPFSTPKLTSNSKSNSYFT
jgi:hypothetical protein